MRTHPCLQCGAPIKPQKTKWCKDCREKGIDSVCETCGAVFLALPTAPKRECVTCWAVRVKREQREFRRLRPAWLAESTALFQERFSRPLLATHAEAAAEEKDLYAQLGEIDKRYREQIRSVR